MKYFNQIASICAVAVLPFLTSCGVQKMPSVGFNDVNASADYQKYKFVYNEQYETSSFLGGILVGGDSGSIETGTGSHVQFLINNQYLATYEDTNLDCFAFLNIPQLGFNDVCSGYNLHARGYNYPTTVGVQFVDQNGLTSIYNPYTPTVGRDVAQFKSCSSSGTTVTCNVTSLLSPYRALHAPNINIAFYDASRNYLFSGTPDQSNNVTYTFQQAATNPSSARVYFRDVPLMTIIDHDGGVFTMDYITGLFSVQISKP